MEDQTFPSNLSQLVQKQGLILGSASPRREEILSFFRIPFRVVKSDFDEESLPFEGNPEAFVAALARGKGAALAKAHPKELILTADTIVFFEGRVYGKPSTIDEGKQFFRELRGKGHEVWTGVCLTLGEAQITQQVKTRVFFEDLTEEQIACYHEKLHTLDKAAGYGIQQAGGILVRKMEGDFYNVMGLPLTGLEALFKQAGLTLWDFLG